MKYKLINFFLPAGNAVQTHGVQVTGVSVIGIIGDLHLPHSSSSVAWDVGRGRGRVVGRIKRKMGR